MRTVFADANYWIALLDSRDSLHASAHRLSDQLRGVAILTSEMVLVELLNALSGRGEQTRLIAGEYVRAIANEPGIEVVPQTTLLFQAALSLYLKRPDQRWGLTDCASMVVMRQRGISEALTADHHFRQAGFATLLD